MALRTGVPGSGRDQQFAALQLASRQGDVLMSHKAKDLSSRTPASPGVIPTLGAQQCCLFAPQNPKKKPAAAATCGLQVKH